MSTKKLDERLERWIREYELEEEIICLMPDGYDAVISFLMDYFDYDEACRIYEYYSV